MKTKRIATDRIYALLALASLLYMNYYRTELHFNPRFFDTPFYNLYLFVALPAAYLFSVAAFSSVVLDLLRVTVPAKTRKALRWLVFAGIAFYVLAALLHLTGVFLISFFLFSSAYKYVFISLGLLLALSVDKSR